MGPRILSKFGDDQSPYKASIYSVSEIQKIIELYKNRITSLENRMNLFTLQIFLRNILLSIPKYGKKIYDFFKFTVMRKTNPLLNPSNSYSNVQLHGSVLIFSKKYYTKYKYCFYPNTFLYCEEDILFYFAQIDSNNLVYSPKIQMLHKEKISTKTITNFRLREMFILKHSINSLTILIELISNNR